MKIMKTIVHISTSLDLGGAENQLLEVCRADDENSNYNYVVAWLKGEGSLAKSFEALGIRTVKPKARNVWLLSTIIKLKIDCAKTRSKLVIHAHLPRAELYGLLLAFLFRIPLVVTKHNCERFWPRGFSNFSRIFALLVYLKSAKVVCISKAVLDYLQSINEIPKNSLKCLLIYYGLFKGDACEIHFPNTEVDSGARKLRLGSLARLEDQKDIPTMMVGAKLLLDQGCEFNFEVCGEGSKRRDLAKLTRDLGIEERFILKGKTTDPLRFLESLDVFVLSSTYEGFGLVLLEAIQVGVPIVVSKFDSAVEILGEDYPYLFDIGDTENLKSHIMRVCKSKDSERARAAYSNALTKFSISSAVQQLQLMYDEI